MLPLAESEANAALIAAAPELLAALVEMVEAFATDNHTMAEHQKRAVLQADAATAKAEGRKR